MIFGQYVHEMCQCRSVQSYRPFQKLVVRWTVENGCDDERRGGAVGVSKLPAPSERARKNDYSDDFRIQVICDGGRQGDHEDIQEQTGSWCDDVLRQPCCLVRTWSYIKPSI